MPISLHKENSLDNASMTKYRARRKRKGMSRKVNSKAVLKDLKAMGITVTERTLQKYVKADLIPTPERRSGGRGRGKITDYQDETPAEFAASWRLIHEGPVKANSEDVSIARKKALRALDAADGDVGWGAFAIFAGKQPPSPEKMLSLTWLGYYKNARAKQVGE